MAWAMAPENRERICKCYQAPAETMARLREMMFGSDHRSAPPNPES